MKSLIFVLVITLSYHLTQAQPTNLHYPFKLEKVGTGKPMILIPGLASDGRVWQETVDSLRPHYTCHVLTLAGFNNSSPLPLDQGFLPIIREQLTMYIQQELREKPILVGHSLGGFLALSVASSNPDIVEKIVIVDSYPFYSAGMNPQATEESVRAQAEFIKQGMLEASPALFEQQQKMTLPILMNNTEKVNTALKWSLNSDRATVAQAMYEIMTTDLRPEIVKVACPILVLGSWYGGKDYGISPEITKQNYENQFKEAKNCQIYIAPKARHFIMWDEPLWFYEKLKAFL